MRHEAGKVKDLIRAQDGLGGGWDLIYSVGLFDYLDERVAARLVGVLVDKLAPGGRVLIGNFRDTPELAWGHVFQDWRLVCRETADLERLVPDGVSASRTYVGPHGIIAWLEISG